MENVGARSLSIGELLRGKTYTLGYFQRGYSWKRKHIIDLIDDLFDEFDQFWQNRETKSAQPPIYFLGPIIVSGRDENLSLIDGQQRLTSISLILIWMAREYPEIKEYILPLIFHKTPEGEQICTLHVEGRAVIMNALYDEGGFDARDKSVSIQNIEKRFGDIDSYLIDRKNNSEKMNAFIDWLIKYVNVVEIKTPMEEDAYKIFETANDRGLRLSPADIFKSYILSNIESDEEKEDLNTNWKNRISEIKNSGENDLNAIRCWLRAGYAKNSYDFDDIGGAFHRWIKNKVKEKEFGLNSSKDFMYFIENDFEFYTRWYLNLNRIAKKYDPNHESIYWNQLFYYTFQHVVILAALKPSDSNNEDVIWKKINLVTTFIDIFMTRRLWNSMPTGGNSMEPIMRGIIHNIQGRGLNYISSFLLDKLDEVTDDEKFPFYDPNYTHIRNKKTIHRILARFSAWLDNECLGKSGALLTYVNTKGKSGYSIEHILPKKFNAYQADSGDFEDEKEFLRYREALGALLLLKGDFNKSYGDIPYDEKLEIYRGQDMILAKILHSSNHKNNPALDKIKTEYKILFEPHQQFFKGDIIKRQRVYTQLAKKIWSRERLKIEAAN